MTSEDVSFPLILIDRHFRVNSSTTVSMRHLPPLWVRASTRSQDRTWLDRSARSWTEGPSPGQIRLRFGCRRLRRSPQACCFFPGSV